MAAPVVKQCGSHIKHGPHVVGVRGGKEGFFCPGYKPKKTRYTRPVSGGLPTLGKRRR